MTAPPPRLMERVSGNADAGVFAGTGKRLAAVLAGAVTARCAEPGAALDWGCGPGRVAAHLAAALPGWDLYGCDIDGEAVAWCAGHIPGVSFTRTGLVPPLPYEDGAFSAVIACSVFTHLDRGLQCLWLAEIRRVLRPGGVLAASVHGESARRAYIPGLPSILADNNGIFDQMIIDHLAGVAPDGYYRAVFQSQEWTRAEWGRYLEIVSYAEAGMEVHDLVVCVREA